LVTRSALLITPGARRQDLLRHAGGTAAHVFEARPGTLKLVLEQLRKTASAGGFSGLVLSTLRIPGVSVRRLLGELTALHDLGVEVTSIKEPWFRLHECGAFLALLDQMLADEKRERILTSLDAARRAGRPPGRQRVQVDLAQLTNLRKSNSLRETARLMGIGPSTAWRLLKELDDLNSRHQESAA
jgi:hypothetical protein